MKKLVVFSLAMAFMLVSVNAAFACNFSGCVYCDVNQNGVIDAADDAFEGVSVLHNDELAAITDENGCYDIVTPGGTNTISLDPLTLPSDVEFIDPATNGVTYIGNGVIAEQDWLIDSEICHPTEEGNCWLTAGGVKFESITGMRMATNDSNGGGPKDSVGGVAYPSCSPFPSNGGQWNHIAHSLKLHLIGQDITVIRCGNVDGIEPGSESPVCDVNFIEFEGTGILNGIHGNNAVKKEPVTFFVRAEDRNEPGNEKALNGNGGADIDRYFLRVVDGGGNVVFLVDEDGNPDTVDPVTITGGNFQMHCTSCF